MYSIHLLITCQKIAYLKNYSQAFDHSIALKQHFSKSVMIYCWIKTPVTVPYLSFWMFWILFCMVLWLAVSLHPQMPPMVSPRVRSLVWSFFKFTSSSTWDHPQIYHSFSLLYRRYTTIYSTQDPFQSRWTSIRAFLNFIIVITYWKSYNTIFKN